MLRQPLRPFRLVFTTGADPVGLGFVTKPQPPWRQHYWREFVRLPMLIRCLPSVKLPACEQQIWAVCNRLC